MCQVYRTPATQQSAGGGVVSTPCGSVLTRGIAVFVRGLFELCIYGRIYDPGMMFYRPRMRWDLGGGLRGNSRGALSHKPRPISNQRMAVGFPYLAGRYRPCGSRFSSQSCWSFRCLKEFPIGGWRRFPRRVRRDLGIGPRSNSIRPLARGAPSVNGVRFPQRAGRYRSGGSFFRPRVVVVPGD